MQFPVVDYLGSLCGYNNRGTINNCSAAGSVGGDSLLGGLCGRNDLGNIIKCCSSGTVTYSGSDAGGLCGSNNYGVYDSFWNTDTSGMSEPGSGTGLTSLEMQDLVTFINAGWDFVGEIENGTSDYWQITTGDLPELRYLSDSFTYYVFDGSGTDVDPYVIDDVNDLGAVWQQPFAHYMMNSHVDSNNINWSDAVVPEFSGVFDGNGYTISNLKIDGTYYTGLIGRVYEGTITDLDLESIDFSISLSDYNGADYIWAECLVTVKI